MSINISHSHFHADFFPSRHPDSNVAGREMPMFAKEQPCNKHSNVPNNREQLTNPAVHKETSYIHYQNSFHELEVNVEWGMNLCENVLFQSLIINIPCNIISPTLTFKCKFPNV